MNKITDNIYVESERSLCNSSFVITRDGVVVIDTPMIPANARAVASEVAEYGPVRYVINTEPHCDHISGNCYFGGICIGHEGVRRTILESKVEEFEEELKMMAPESLPIDPEFRFRVTDITFSEEMTLFLGDHTFQLIHMPGHSPYQAAVYIPEEKVVFTSDNVSLDMAFFKEAVPDRWLESLEKLEQLDVKIVVPGHGKPGPKSYFGDMNKIVRRWLEAVAAAIDEGMTSEEAQEKITLAVVFPGTPKDNNPSPVTRMNVARIYEYLKGR